MRRFHSRHWAERNLQSPQSQHVRAFKQTLAMHLALAKRTLKSWQEAVCEQEEGIAGAEKAQH
jgi:hypothetical protein